MNKNIADAIEEIALHLSSVAESTADGSERIEQALADVAMALEAAKPTDLSKLIDAIKGIALTVNPTPVQVIVEPTPFHINLPPAESARFRPLVFRVIDYNHQGRIQTVEIAEKP